jgi:UDP-sugar diphosphatase
MRYQIAGIERTWDCVQAHDGVAVLLYHKQRRAFILVRQFRPAVLLARLKTQGVTDLNSVSDADVAFAFTTELCAGIVDKSKSLEEIACEEVMEECGYSISPSGSILMSSL